MRARGERRRRARRPEAFFRAALRGSVADDAARLLLGEWFAEHGDRRAAGYRWLARRRKEPSAAASTWDWWHEDSTNRREIVLPDHIWQLLAPPPVDSFPNCKEFKSLDAAEEAVCTIIHALGDDA